MRITGLKTNHLETPLGFDASRVLLSYRVEESAGRFETAARIQLSTAPDEALLSLDTGLCQIMRDEKTGRVLHGIDNLGWTLPCAVAPRTRYFWRVFARTDAGEEAWSDWAWFETGKAPGEPWRGEAIASPFGPQVHPVFCKPFTVQKPVASARLYCLGLGVYEAYLNGEKLGDEVLMPGLHTYDRYLQIQTLELEPRRGENTLAFMLGDGWYKGRYGLKASAPRYGEDYALIAELRIRYADGSEEIIGTDEDWQVCPGPVTFDGIYDGETFDARLLQGQEHRAAVRSPLDTSRLVPRISPCVRVQETFVPVRISQDPLLLDFGQNMAGWVRFVCDAPRGTRVTLRFAEILKDGQLYRDNLRNAAQTFTYISDGNARLVQPHFTYFGFRYVSVEGWDAPPEAFTACAIYSDMERIGFIETANAKVNRLFENVIWSQKSNFLDVPTDCPQRDERMGWTGDIQIFSDTALFNADCTAFLRKFLRDLRCDQQTLGGAVPCVTPMAGYRLAGVAAWGDAATVVPYAAYLHSGDEGILREALPSMTVWVDWITRQTELDGTGFLWSRGQQFGDWLALDGRSVYGGTDRALIATAYYAYSADLTARAAAILGEVEIADRYAALAQNIRKAFEDEYFSPSGRLCVDTQTACAVVSEMGLAPENALDRVHARLCELLTEAGLRLETGFVGTPCLLSALTRAGRADLAYTLLLREDYPGWLYEVNLGATTIWERWNSIEPDGAMNRDGMNSFNHYAYGSVATWLYRTLGGISPVERAPGLRLIDCAPMPDRRIPWAKVRLMTGSGLCTVSHRWAGDRLSFAITVPFDCAMRLHLPDGSDEKTLTAGEHRFEIEMPAPIPAGLDTPWRELLDNSETRAVIERLFPRAIRGIAFQYEMLTMREVIRSPFAELSREEIDRLEREIIRAQRA